MMDLEKNRAVLAMLKDPRSKVRDALEALEHQPEGEDVEEVLDEALFKPWRDWSAVPDEVNCVIGLLAEVRAAAEGGARALLEASFPEVKRIVKINGKYPHQVFEELVVTALLDTPGARELCEGRFGLSGELHYVEIGDCEHVDALWRALSVLHGPVNYNLAKAPVGVLTSTRFVSPDPECDTTLSEVVEDAARVLPGDDERTIEAVESLWQSRTSLGLEGLFEVARAL